MNLEVVSRNEEKGVIFVAGSVPGPDGGARPHPSAQEGGRNEAASCSTPPARNCAKSMPPMRSSASSRTAPSSTRPTSPRWANRRARQRPHPDAAATSTVRPPRSASRRASAGRARAASAPRHQVGGGVAHGPQPHSFAKDLPAHDGPPRAALGAHQPRGQRLAARRRWPQHPGCEDAQSCRPSSMRSAWSAARSSSAARTCPSLTRAARNIDNAKAHPGREPERRRPHQRAPRRDDRGRRPQPARALWGGVNVKPPRGRTKEAAV